MNISLRIPFSNEPNRIEGHWEWLANVRHDNNKHCKIIDSRTIKIYVKIME